LNFDGITVVPGFLGFQRTWWNFSEAGHGRWGAMADGVDAAVKRLADRRVLQERWNFKMLTACVPQ